MSKSSSRGGYSSLDDSASILDTPAGAASLATVLLVAGLFVLALVGAIVFGVRTENIQTAINKLTPTLTVVPLPSGSVCANESKAEPRRAKAYQTRVNTAFAEYQQPVPCHPNNGDEALYAPVYFASFSKGMQHDALGHVAASSYQALLKAVSTGVSSDFDAIPQAFGAVRDFTNPQAGLALSLEGGDSHSFYQKPAPAFASAEQAGEIVENYWMALLRDVPFADYGTNTLAGQAIASLNALTDFKGPKPVTAANLFRGKPQGCEIGPYMSQFFYLPCVFGANSIDQKLTPPVTGVDFMTNFTEYLRVQNGLTPAAALTYASTPRHIVNGRDLAHWVHIDVLLLAALSFFFSFSNFIFFLVKPISKLCSVCSTWVRLSNQAFLTLFLNLTKWDLVLLAPPLLHSCPQPVRSHHSKQSGFKSGWYIDACAQKFLEQEYTST